MSLTQTIVEERLMPQVTAVSTHPISNKLNKSPLPSTLIRSSSFHRLRQFPSSLSAYLCRNGSVAIFQWLLSSQTQLSSTVSQLLPQLRSFLLLCTLYTTIAAVSLQLAMCLLALLTSSLPSGLAFLMTCILAMAALGIKLNLPHTSPRRSRSPSRAKRD